MVQKTSTVYTTANYIYSAHSRFTDPPCNDTNTKLKPWQKCVGSKRFYMI